MALKVIHLATVDVEGGAARAAYRQHRALLEAGIDSQMLVRFKSGIDDTVHVFHSTQEFWHRVRRVIYRYYLKSWRYKVNKQAYNPSINGTLLDPRSEVLEQLDDSLIEDNLIINLHKVQDFVNLFSFFKSLPRNIPIVVTLHDLGFMTGGCDYPSQCSQFQQSCGKCPILLSSNTNDTSATIYQWKKEAYQQRIRERLAFVANSNWTLEQAQSSSLLSPYPCQTIHYGIDSTIYNPQKRQLARQALGLPTDQPILLFSAYDISHERKGGRYVTEVLQNLNSDHHPIIITFGQGQFPVGNYQSFHFGRVDNERLQSLIYQAADVFLMPSLQEAFGQTALEAVACGTVVAGFSGGGIPDIVVNGLNGILVPSGNGAELFSAVLELMNNLSLRQHWIEQTQAWVAERFSYQINADNYINLYQKLLK